MKVLFLIFFLIVFISSKGIAKEQSRPDSIGGDYLFEVTTGVVFEESEDVPEIGIDLERFIDGTAHHFSIGIAGEFDFYRDGTRYYIGPLVSMYYFHLKVFYTVGIFSDLSNFNEDKHRFGVGYEFFLKHDFILVPTVAVDFVNDETHIAINIGLAHEF